MERDTSEAIEYFLDDAMRALDKLNLRKKHGNVSVLVNAEELANIKRNIWLAETLLIDEGVIYSDHSLPQSNEEVRK
ncbi:MAG: hypothetical protein MKZ93_06950 [Prochlorococcus sp. ALOHA_A2.0_51]|jgi:hypothetical protein|nr:hypothetical protein [Prochlorococcus sp. ALOHA_A2.0_51]|tara:strand:- start:1060 stop:1290 length:231 start_codon:yes stop_codon:yes gene_type:complete